MFSLLSADEAFSKFFLDAGQGAELSEVDKVHYYTFTSNLLRVCENGNLRNRENAISPEHWESIVRMMIDYSKMMSLDECWASRKH